MATVQSIIDSARYDLRDYHKGVAFGNAELLDYINRMIGIMDSTLASLGSDLVEAEETTIDTVADQNYIDISGMNSGLWDSIRSVWIGSDEVEKVGINLMRFKRIFRSGSAKPQYWCLSNRNILFEQDADQAYTDVSIYYNKKTSVLTLASSMPYNDIFNEMFREMLVLHAKAKKEGRVTRGDSLYAEMFRTRAMQEQVRRDWVKKPYYIDF
jgi:hypothetical protein